MTFKDILIIVVMIFAFIILVATGSFITTINKYPSIDYRYEINLISSQTIYRCNCRLLLLRERSYMFYECQDQLKLFIPVAIVPFTFKNLSPDQATEEYFSTQICNIGD